MGVLDHSKHALRTFLSCIITCVVSSKMKNYRAKTLMLA